MNENEQLRKTLATVFAGLGAAGFRLPMELVITGSGGGFVGFRLEEDGSVLEEFGSPHRVISFPLVVRVFDDSGKKHKVTIVNDCEDHEQPEKPMEVVLQ
jgi:hypothetical protein